MAYLPILTYHRVLADAPTKSSDPQRIAVGADQFRTHLSTLHRLGYRTVNLNEYPDRLKNRTPFPARRFGITFDDGYEDNATVAAPILREFGFTATIFAVPGATRNSWDDAAARLLTPVQMKALEKEGFQFGAHTCHHVHLTRVDRAVAREEIRDSKTRLEEMLGHSVTTLAYPYGESNAAVESIAREAGFAMAFSCDDAPRAHEVNPFRVRRVVIFPRNNVWEVLWKVQRWYPAYQDFKRRKSAVQNRPGSAPEDTIV